MRRFQHLGIAFISLFGALIVAVGCSRGPEESAVGPTLKTGRLEIVDAAGAPRIVLGIDDKGRPSLALSDQSGDFRAWMFLGEDGSPNLFLVNNPRFILMDAKGEIRAAQRLDGTGSPSFILLDGDGKIRTNLRLGEDGSPIVEFFDTSGNPVEPSP